MLLHSLVDGIPTAHRFLSNPYVSRVLLIGRPSPPASRGVSARSWQHASPSGHAPHIPQVERADLPRRNDPQSFPELKPIIENFDYKAARGSSNFTTLKNPKMFWSSVGRDSCCTRSREAVARLEWIQSGATVAPQSPVDGPSQEVPV